MKKRSINKETISYKGVPMKLQTSLMSYVSVVFLLPISLIASEREKWPTPQEATQQRHSRRQPPVPSVLDAASGDVKVSLQTAMQPASAPAPQEFRADVKTDQISIPNVPQADLGYVGKGIESHLYNVLRAKRKGHVKEAIAASALSKGEINKAIELSLAEKIPAEEQMLQEAKQNALATLAKQETASHKTYLYELLNIVSEEGFSLDEDVARNHIEFCEQEKVSAMQELLQQINATRLRMLRAHQAVRILMSKAKIDRTSLPARRPLTPTEDYEALHSFLRHTDTAITEREKADATEHKATTEAK